LFQFFSFSKKRITDETKTKRKEMAIGNVQEKQEGFESAW